MNKIAFLGIGGNIGDKEKNIGDAIFYLKNTTGINVEKVSSFYETEPVGYVDQDWFLNVVVKISTSLEPYKLLKVCQDIEEELKRVRLIRWGPRSIDVDVLLYEDFISEDEKLIVPHPRMTDRAFVMVPLYEIEKEISINGINIKKIIENLKGEKISLLK